MVEKVLENEVTPSGISNLVLNIGQRRMRAEYFRKDSDGNWIKTRPLPADPLSRSYYFGKGFRGRPPEVKGETTPAINLNCPSCEFVAKSEFGLSVHQRSHKS